MQTLNAEWVNIRSRLKVGAGADGIQIDGQDAVIKSNNFDPAGRTGWKIDKDGSAEFNNGKFKGHIEADSGTFHGCIEAEEGYFRGSIISGPLVLIDETPVSTQNNYYTNNPLIIL